MKTKLTYLTASHASKCALMLLLFAPFLELFSQQLDPNFGTAGIVNTSFNDDGSYIEAVAVQPDGKIVALGGSYDESEDYDSFAIARYLVNGSLDMGFGTQGKVVLDIANGKVSPFGIAINASGQIYAAGQIEDSENHFLALLARLNSHGTLDTNFGNNGVVLTTFEENKSSAASSVLVQPNEKILIAGASATFDDEGVADNYNIGIARFNSDGSLDGNFGNSGLVNMVSDSNTAILTMKLQPDGKIVAAGFNEVSEDTGSEDIVLLRFNSNGSIDTNFGINGMIVKSIGTNEEVADLNLQTDGKILVTGSTKDDTDSDFFALRYTGAGIEDATFGTGGIVTLDFDDLNDYASAILVQTDGKIVLSGNNGNNIALARLLANGKPDGSFGNNGKLRTDVKAYSQDGKFSNDGKLLIAGYSDDDNDFEDNFFLAQFDIDAPLGIDEKQNGTLAVYPNPTSSFIHIDHLNSFQKMDAILYDLLGNKVLTANLNSGQGNMDLSGVKTGVYVMHIQMGKNNLIRKIVKN